MYRQKILASFAEQSTSFNCSMNGESQIVFTINDPELWWPAGYGDQPLYTLNIELDGQTISKRIGLRKLELNTTQDRVGSSMEFQINAFPITAKGANWIPLDAMPSNETEARYRTLLQSAIDANMNMIRVWGGGQYESDLFL